MYRRAGSVSALRCHSGRDSLRSTLYACASRESVSQARGSKSKPTRPEAKGYKALRFPRFKRKGLEFRFSHLASEFGIGHSLADNLRNREIEPLSIVHALAVVEAERLLVKIPKQVERLDADVSTVYAPLEQAPEVFQPVSVYAAIDIFLGMVNDLMRVFLRQSIVREQVRAHVEAGAALYSDALLSYDGLSEEYAHKVIDHAEKYVDGRVHTNGLENFWSLFKRGVNGTYISVEPFHLFRYLDEQMFRFNNRATKDNPLTDADRFDLAVRNIVGKRITFAELTGKPN